MMTASTHIGTSGWHYDHWKGPFYPEDLPSTGFLEHYAGCFDTAEINNSFYRLPEEKTLVGWREIVPEGFVFSVKASRYLTHMKKLKDPEEPLENLLVRVSTLEDKLGPILFQLPSRWKMNAERLESFLDALPEGHRYAFEFWDESWFDEQLTEPSFPLQPLYAPLPNIDQLNLIKTNNDLIKSLQNRSGRWFWVSRCGFLPDYS